MFGKVSTLIHHNCWFTHMHAHTLSMNNWNMFKIFFPFSFLDAIVIINVMILIPSFYFSSDILLYL